MNNLQAPLIRKAAVINRGGVARAGGFAEKFSDFELTELAS